MTPPKSITTRSALLLMLLAIVFLISASILVVVDFGARRTIRDLSQRYIEQSSDRIQSKMSHFFGSIEEFLNVSRSWWEAGMLDYTGRADLQRLNALYIPLLDQHPQITSMMIPGAGLSIPVQISIRPIGPRPIFFHHQRCRADRLAKMAQSSDRTNQTRRVRSSAQRFVALHLEPPPEPERRGLRAP